MAYPALLFAEDFDAPSPYIAETPLDLAPEPIEPAYSFSDLQEARAQAATSARAALQAEIADSHQMVVGLALGEICQMMGDVRHTAEALAETHTAALSVLLVRLLRTALPAACAHYGASEAAAMLLALRPALLAEPQVCVQLHPTIADALVADIAAMQSALPGNVLLIPNAAMAPADVRVSWQDGCAVRDTRALLAAIDVALGDAGLFTDQGAISHAV